MLLWAGQSISEIGNATTMFALPVVALLATHASTFEVSGLAAMSQLPVLLFALPLGAVVDRRAKRPMMIGADLVRMVLSASIPAAGWLGILTVTQLFVVAFGAATCGILFDAAYHSYTPVLLTREELVDGNAKIGTSESVSVVSGPSLAGFLVGVIGAAATLTVDAASYLVSVATVASIRARETPPLPAPAGTRFGALGGLRFIYRDRRLRPLVTANAVDSFVMAAVNALWTVYVIRTLRWSPQTAGFVLGVSATGGVLGGLVATRLIRRFGMHRMLVACEFVKLPGLLTVPLATRGVWGEAYLTAGYVVVLGSAVTYNITQRTVRQLACPPELLGRVTTAARWLQWGLMPVGSVLAGAIATVVGVRATLFGAGIGTAASVAVLFFSPLRRPDPAPSPSASAAPV